MIKARLVLKLGNFACFCRLLIVIKISVIKIFNWEVFLVWPELFNYHPAKYVNRVCSA